MIIDIKKTVRGGYSQWWKLDSISLDPKLEQYILNLLVQAEVHNLSPELLADLTEDTDVPCYIISTEGEHGSQTVKIHNSSMTNQLRQLVEQVTQYTSDRGDGTWEDYDLQQITLSELQPLVARLIQQPPPGLNQDPQFSNYLAGQLLDLVWNWDWWRKQTGQSTTRIEKHFSKSLQKKAQQLTRRGPLRALH